MLKQGKKRVEHYYLVNTFYWKGKTQKVSLAPKDQMTQLAEELGPGERTGVPTGVSLLLLRMLLTY